MPNSAVPRNGGVHVLRNISTDFRSIPPQVRHSTKDPRILVEISFAGGVAESAVEASQIPSMSDNAESIAAIRTVLDTYHARDGDVDPAEVRAGEEILTTEVESIVDSALAAGRDDFGAAIGHGYLDILFSPSVFKAGAAVAIRDRTGAVRFAVPGRPSLPANVLDHHRGLGADRVRAEGKAIEEMLEDDIPRVARGHFDSGPLREWVSGERM